MPNSPKVAILLCTFHGQHHLAEQLESFSSQSYSNWKVFASDDGSQDGTHSVLEAYRSKWSSGRISVQLGPSEGFAANFLSLSCDANIQAEYYAYSDQDDIWGPDKLERAVAWLEQVGQGKPALYCTRTRLVDVNNKEIGLSPLFARAPSFPNALAQNIGGGNSMVFNEAARHLLKHAGADVNVVSHDWWLYLVVTGCGGVVCYDPHPSLRYRQHDANLIGMNAGWRARWQRVLLLLEGRFKEWNDTHIAAMERIEQKLTVKNQHVLSEFSKARQTWLLPRLVRMKRCGIHRQTFLGNVGLFFAILANRL